jgi:hypothetical protein
VARRVKKETTELGAGNFVFCQELSMKAETNVRRCHRGSSADSNTHLFARIARVAALALVVSCAPPIDRTDDGVDRGQDDLAGITQQPSQKVCNAGARWECKAWVRADGSGHIQHYANTSGIGPADIKSAYKLDTTKGAGATIAIIDAYNYPNAESDLAAYRSNYGLPPCTKANGCLKIVNQSGATSPLPANSPSGDDWSVEAALDLDSASAACPNCKIILIEANDDQGDGLYTSNDTAASLGATVASNSWGGPDGGSGPGLESHFNHSGTGYFVASGDNGNTGASPDYPSTSAYVTGVGGTSLVKSSSGTRGWTEGAWNGAGSSCSNDISKPSWQTQSACSGRAAADVSAVADPNTGVAVYNAANGGWIVVGGTSAACPIVASIYALTGHGNAGPSYAYGHATSYFDVTTGTNGSCSGAMCHAGAGWDGPTGLGTPNGASLGGGTCTPSCTGKVCGPDGCGGTCGSCGANQTCTAAGQCQNNGCTPSCSGKTCGDDGCGGSCGSCASGQTCSTAGQCTGGGGSCSHPICSTGGALTGGCDSCAGSICSVDSYCCTTAWDSICVGEVSSVCGQSCTGGGGGSCTHPECNTGTKLKSGCDACVTKVCGQDSYCCNNRWDSICVGEVGSICGEACN